MNSSRKSSFIIYCVKSEPWLLTKEESVLLANQYFSLLEPYEDLWGMDIADQRHKEIDAAIDCIALDVDLTLCDSMERDLVQLSISKVVFLYNIWCYKHGYTKSRDAQWIRRSEDIRFLLRAVSSPDHLLDIMSQLDSPELETKDCLIRGYIWLLYYGVTPREAISLTISDFDNSKSGVYVGDRFVQLSGDAYNTISKLASLDYFRTERLQYRDRVGFIPRKDGNLLFRRSDIGCKTDVELTTEDGLKSSSVYFFRHFPNKDRISPKISQYSVFLSGAFYRASQYEKAAGFVYPYIDSTIKRAIAEPYGIYEIDHSVELLIKGELDYRAIQRTSSYGEDAKLRRTRRIVYRDYNLWKQYFNA